MDISRLLSKRIACIEYTYAFVSYDWIFTNSSQLSHTIFKKQSRERKRGYRVKMYIEFYSQFNKISENVAVTMSPDVLVLMNRSLPMKLFLVNALVNFLLLGCYLSASI